ncbi:MAG: IS1 family transposase [Chloroflexota bacterium]|nr:IS1 family transposase [Chloroflexota bacterium]
MKLQVDAGDVCADHHDQVVNEISPRYVQVDEMWSFCYAKSRNRATARGVIDGAGSIYTWIGIDVDTKLIIAWTPGRRDRITGGRFMHDLASRLDDRVVLSSDGFATYPQIVDDAFDEDEVDYVQLHVAEGVEIPSGINNVYIERHNLTMRMSNRRLNRRTNAFSKKYRNHVASLALYFTYYNFCRVHSTIETTPAIEAGLDDTQRDLEWIVDMLDMETPPPNRPATYRTVRARRSRVLS